MSDRRYRRGLWLARLVALAPPLILIAWIGVYTSSVVHRVLRNLPQVVSAAASASVHRQVRIGSISDVLGPDHLVLRDVSISDGPTFAQSHGVAIASAPRVNVYLRITQLVHDPANPAASVTRVAVTRPSVRVERRPGNKYNFQTLFQHKPRPGAKPFAGRIFVSDGAVNFYDYAAPAALAPAHNRASHVTGYVSFATPSTAIFSAVGDGGFGRFGQARVAGAVLSVPGAVPGTSRIGRYVVRVDAARADAAYWVRYFLAAKTGKIGRVEAGTADVALTVAAVNPGPGVALDISGSAVMHEARLVSANRRILAAPVDHVNGHLAFTTDSVAVAATGLVDGMPVAASGAVPSFRRPVVSFRVTAPSVNPARLHAIVPAVPTAPAWLEASAPASVVLSAIGPAARPRFDVTFTDPAARVYGERITAIRGGVVLAGRVLTVKSLVASTPGRVDNVEARGVFDSAAPARTTLAAHITGVSLASLTLPDVLRRFGPVTGMVDADVRYDSRPAMPVAATVRLTDASVRGIHITEAALDAVTNLRVAQIHRLAVVQPDGAVWSVSGEAPLRARSPAPFDLALDISGADLGPLARAVGLHAVTGYAYFRGRVNGHSGAPTASGRLDLFNAAYGRYAVDHARADVAYAPGVFTVASGVAQRLGISAHFSGHLAGFGTAKPSIAALIGFQDVEVAALSGLAQDAPGAGSSAQATALRRALLTTSGVVNGHVSVSGSLHAPAIGLDVNLADGSADGFDISEASLLGSYYRGLVRVIDLTGRVDGAVVLASGAYRLATGAAVGRASISGLDLADLARSTASAVQVTGIASGTASFSGTLRKPTLTGRVSLASASYDGVPVSSAAADFAYADGVLSATSPWTARSGPATYTVRSLRYDVAAKVLDATLTERGETVARLVRLAQASGSSGVARIASRLPTGLDGALAISNLTVDGPIRAPAIAVDASATGLGFQSGQTDRLAVQVAASYGAGRVRIVSLEARGPVEYLSASGTLATSGPIAAKLDASNIPFWLLAPFAPSLKRVAGSVSDLTLAASGTAAQPEVRASVSLRDVAYGRFRLDRIDSGLISAGGGRLDISGLTLAESQARSGVAPIEHVATLQGSLPFDFAFDHGIRAFFPADEPLSLTTSLPRQSISLISLFLPSMRAYTLTGSVQAALQLGGTLRHKTVSGSAQIVGATISDPAFHTSLTNIDVSAVFSGDSGTITSSRIESSAGGYLTLDGAVSTGGAVPTRFGTAAQALLSGLRMDLAIRAVGFMVNEPKLAALYDAGLRGVIEGNLKATGPLTAPTVSGAVTVAHAVGTMPTLQVASVPAPAPPPFDPTFDVAVTIAPGGQIRSAQIQATTDGRFRLAGSLYRPDLEGTLFLRSGRFSLPTAIFRIIPPGDVHFVYNPPEETTERVDLTAQTNISISPEILAANPTGPGGVTSTLPFTYETSVYSPVTSGAPQQYLVTVTVSGELNAPHGLHVDFESNPPGLSQEQILAALGGQSALNALLVTGNVQEAFQSEMEQVFTSYALPTLLEPVETGIASAFGLAEFDVSYAPDTPVALSFVKELGPRLDLRYTRFVNSRVSPGAVGNTLTPLQYSAAVDYRLTNRLSVTVSDDDQNNAAIGLSGTFGF